MLKKAKGKPRGMASKSSKGSASPISLTTLCIVIALLAVCMSVGKDFASGQAKRMEESVVRLIAEGNELENDDKLADAVSKYREATTPKPWPWNSEYVDVLLGEQISKLELETRTVGVYLRMAKLCERMDQYGRAIAYARKARAIKPRSEDTLRLLIIVMSASDNEQEVAEVRGITRA